MTPAKRLTAYLGPPVPDGQDRAVFYLPRDRDALDAAWNAFYAAHPDLDPSPDVTAAGDATDRPDNAWSDVPF